MVARPAGDVTGQVSGIVIAELITGGALILLLAVSGRWLIGRGLSPLKQMATTAHQITSRGDLTARMPETDDSTEVGQLGGAIKLGTLTITWKDGGKAFEYQVGRIAKRNRTVEVDGDIKIHENVRTRPRLLKTF